MVGRIAAADSTLPDDVMFRVDAIFELAA